MISFDQPDSIHAGAFPGVFVLLGAIALGRGCQRLTRCGTASSTRDLDRFKIIIQDIEAAGRFTIHGVALGSSLAYEALYASTGVSHLGG